MLRFLIIFSIIINALGLFSSVSGGDAGVYSVLAKHIVLSHDWIDLTFSNHAWLDKPHFPFWITALSYKIFGINAFAYIFPGFLFNLIGARYTYLLAKKLYSTHVGLLSALIYLSSLNLMLFSIDIEAEAYLLGEIIPACYYWLCYDKDFRIFYVLAGAFFTALAMMTKGIFVLVPIFSGLGLLWIFQCGFLKAICRLLSMKWLLALLLSFCFILPELISLYVQFNLHPNLLVFGHTHVSGIKFFFWDSQFGRFFDTGPIAMKVHHADIAHYFYYIHVILWAFLPWSILFLIALFVMKSKEKNYIYLLGSFFPTFVMFSITHFQFDHYINIILPFAAILVASNIAYSENNKTRYTLICRVQNILSLLLCVTAMIFSIGILRTWPVNGTIIFKLLFSSIIIFSVVICFYIINQFKKTSLSLAITASVFSACIAFLFILGINEMIYRLYDKGYIISHYLKDKPAYFIVDQIRETPHLELSAKRGYQHIGEINNIIKQPTPYYLLVKQEDWIDIQSKLLKAYQTHHKKPTLTVLNTFHWMHVRVFREMLSELLNKNKRHHSGGKVVLVVVGDLSPNCRQPY